jgi:small subunit ribosomal protein S1
VNQLVDVKVIRIDPENRKITLSLRALHANPWDDFAKGHRPGARVNGTVTRIADFGAFVEIAPGIEGLIHVSELSTQRVRRPSDVVKEGQPVEVQIINLDAETRRIALSLKAIQAAGEAAEVEAEEAEKKADEAEAAVRMANRPVNSKLRGGLGGGKLLFETE